MNAQVKATIKQLACFHDWKQQDTYHLSILKFKCTKCERVDYWV